MKQAKNNLKYLFIGIIGGLSLIFVACGEDSFVAKSNPQKGTPSKEKVSDILKSNNKCDGDKNYCATFTFTDAFIDKMNLNTATNAEMEMEFKSDKNNILSRISFYYMDQINEYTPKKLYEVRYSTEDTEASNQKKNPKKWDKIFYELMGFPYLDHRYVNQGLGSDKKYGYVGWKSDKNGEQAFITMYEKALPKNDYEVIILRMEGEEGDGDGAPISSPFKGSIWYKRIDRPDCSSCAPHIAHWSKSITRAEFGAYPGDDFLNGKTKEPGGVFTDGGIQMGTFKDLD